MDKLYKDILKFQRTCRDCIDDRSASSARALENEVQRLEDEAQVQKNPKSLENRTQSVIKHLKKVRSDGAMSHHDVDMLEKQCEAFIQRLRKM